MGDPKGFMTTARETPRRRPVDVRLTDWREVYEPFAAERLLTAWESEVEAFRKVMPKDYQRVLAVMRDAEAAGLSEDETLKRVMEAAHG